MKKLKSAKYGAPIAEKKVTPKALDPRNHDWQLHPEDKKMMVEGVAYGLEHAAEFVAQSDVDLEELIATYSDAEAEAKLNALRERFWAQIWVPGQPKSADETKGK